MYILFTIISPIINKFSSNSFNVNDVFNTEKYERKIAEEDNNFSAKLEQNNNKTIKEVYILNLTSDIKTKLKEKGYNVLNSDIQIKDDESYQIKRMVLNVNKDNQSNKDNIINNIEIDRIQINTNTISEVKENTITENQKQEIREYLSKVYELDAKSIEIS